MVENCGMKSLMTSCQGGANVYLHDVTMHQVYIESCYQGYTAKKNRHPTFFFSS